MIKWTFCFENTHLAVETKEASEDERIRNAIKNKDEYLHTTGQDAKEALINLGHVKLIVRELVADETPLPAMPSLEAEGI